MDESNPILPVSQVYDMHAERDRLRLLRDACQKRMDEIDAALVASGEARLKLMDAEA
jgi:hypothetical protein